VMDPDRKRTSGRWVCCPSRTDPRKTNPSSATIAPGRIGGAAEIDQWPGTWNSSENHVGSVSIGIGEWQGSHRPSQNGDTRLGVNYKNYVPPAHVFAFA
jgi:hypothetical protein